MLFNIIIYIITYNGGKQYLSSRQKTISVSWRINPAQKESQNNMGVSLWCGDLFFLP